MVDWLSYSITTIDVNSEVYQVLKSRLRIRVENILRIIQITTAVFWWISKFIEYNNQQSVGKVTTHHKCFFWPLLSVFISYFVCLSLRTVIQNCIEICLKFFFYGDIPSYVHKYDSRDNPLPLEKVWWAELVQQKCTLRDVAYH